MASDTADNLLKRALTLPGISALVDGLGEEFTPRVLLVGGAVRDLLRGTPVLDIDLAVEGPVADVAGRLGKAVRAHDRFGTATVTVDGQQFDLARTRRESYPQPGALPVVEPADAEEDLARRDFTVNAIALPLTGRGRGELISVPEALTDLQHGVIRVLHERSFLEDPTRLLRLARYGSRLRFEVEPSTRELAAAAVSSGALDTVTGPRIGSELRLFAREPDPVAPWQWLRELAIDRAIAAGFGLREPDLAKRALGILPEDASPEVVMLALAVMGVSPEERAVLLDRLAAPARLRDDVLNVAARAGGVADALREAERPSEVAAAIESAARSGAGPELAAVAGAMGPGAPAELWLNELRHMRPQITGVDLQAAGVAPGPALGAGLAAARDALLDGRAGSREEQLREAQRAARNAG